MRVCRSEAECRREFGCTEPNCPLETAFGLKKLRKEIEVKPEGYLRKRWDKTKGVSRIQRATFRHLKQF